MDGSKLKIPFFSFHHFQVSCWCTGVHNPYHLQNPRFDSNQDGRLSFEEFATASRA